jgi:hypothetical protein
MKKILKGPNGLKVELDRSEICLEDPGQGTPALVIKKVQREEFSSTFNCAMGEGELLGRSGAVQLTQKELQWLASVEDSVENFLYATL